MEEPSLHSQTSALGEAMRAYRSFSLPGIDILLDRMELNTAKQVQSVSHQSGCRGILSEMYGATNWTATFQDYKGQGDWQGALGVTLRCLHLSLVSMAGESKRDLSCINQLSVGMVQRVFTGGGSLCQSQYSNDKRQTLRSCWVDSPY